jgi:DNA-binding HxlR family transcriptional regulator
MSLSVPSPYAQPIDRLSDLCPVRAALDVIRGRWKPSILFELKSSVRRFSDLQEALPGVSAQVLTVQLRQLEADEIICRTVFAEVPTRVEYQLSEYGRTLSGVLDQLEAWGGIYQARIQARSSGS